MNNQISETFAKSTTYTSLLIYCEHCYFSSLGCPSELNGTFAVICKRLRLISNEVKHQHTCSIKLAQVESGSPRHVRINKYPTK